VYNKVVSTLRHADGTEEIAESRGKLAPGGARKRSPAAMGLIIKLCKRFGERGHDWGALLAWRPGFLHDFSGKYKYLLS
jgi:hypothetical protein